MSEKHFTVKFWGVRGTIPTPGTNTIRYGGQTSCVQVNCGGRELIFDMGTGLYPLGEALKTRDIDVFLSHTHLDHIMGFPFFSPAYNKDYTLRIWAGHLLPDNTIRATLSQLMSPPIFPLTLDFLSADVSYHDFNAGEAPGCTHLSELGIQVSTLPLNHPDRATAYRVDYEGKSMCYVTDVEHVGDGLDQTLIEFIKDTNIFIYDSTFDDRDFDRFVGWGHSTWQEAARLSDAANVETLVLFHHDPGRSDNDLDKRLEELELWRPNDRIAREGLVLTLL